MDFPQWLKQEMETQGLTQRDIALRGGISEAQMSRVMNGDRNAGPDVCVAIARALNYPPDLVFRKAGILPDKPLIAPNVNEMNHLFIQLDDDDQQSFLIMLRAIVQEKVRRASMPRQTPSQL